MSVGQIRTRTLEDFIKDNPSMESLYAPNRIDFNPDDLSKGDVDVLKVFFRDLCLDLTIYMDMFSIPENSEELNKFNDLIFSRLERMSLERICLKFSTLMDPPKSCGNENLSLKRFLNQANSKLLNDLYAELHTFYVDSGIKVWRNTVLAHADLATMSGNVKLNINFTQNDIDNFVAQMLEFIDWLDSPEVATDHRITLPFSKDVNSFINKIRRSNENEL